MLENIVFRDIFAEFTNVHLALGISDARMTFVYLLLSPLSYFFFSSYITTTLTRINIQEQNVHVYLFRRDVSFLIFIFLCFSIKMNFYRQTMRQTISLILRWLSIRRR